MKKLALLLALLTLTGCSSLLNRNYRSVRPHVSQTSDPSDPEDVDALRAENYAELVNDVQYFVSTGVQEGVVHLYGYTEEVEADLNAVCEELLTQDSLCCWALEDIQWERSHLLAYEECVFRFTYRIDPAEISTIQTAVGSSAIRELLAQTLSQFNSRLVLQTSSYYAKEDLLLNLTQQAYDAQPGYALGYPQVSVQIYPPDSQSPGHLVEINLNYGMDQLLLQERAQRVTSVAATMVGINPAQGSVGYWLLYSRLAELNHFAPKGDASVYSALISGNASSEGMALAYQYLCQRSQLECLLVQGTLDGTPHCWNMVNADGVWRHVDVTQGLAQEDFLCSDAQIAQRYTWDTEQYPACGEQNEASDSSHEEIGTAAADQG